MLAIEEVCLNKIPDRPAGNLPTVAQVKSNIMTKFMSHYMSNFVIAKDKNSNLPSSEEIQKLMREWSSKGGSALAQTYTNKMDEFIRANDIDDKLLTSGGLYDKVAEQFNNKKLSEIPLGSRGTNKKILMTLQKGIKNYSTIMNSGLLNDAEILTQLNNSGLSVFKDIKFNTTGIISQADLKKLKKSTNKNIESLGVIIEALQNVSSTTIKSRNGTELHTVEEVMQSIAGSLNKLGGEDLAEVLAVMCGNACKEQLAKAMTESMSSLGKDGSMKFVWDEGMAASINNKGPRAGKQLKSDYRIEWTDDNVKIVFPVSLKTIKGSNNLTKNNLITNNKEFQGGIKLSEIFEYGKRDLEITKLWFEQAAGTAWKTTKRDKTVESDYANFNNVWTYMIQIYKLYAAYISMFGSMQNYVMNDAKRSTQFDLGSLLVINNRIYTSLDIIKVLDTLIAPSGAGTIADWRSQILLSKVQESADLGKKERMLTVTQQLKELYAKKIEIKIKLSLLREL